MHKLALKLLRSPLRETYMFTLDGPYGDYLGMLAQQPGERYMSHQTAVDRLVAAYPDLARLAACPLGQKGKDATGCVVFRRAVAPAHDILSHLLFSHGDDDLSQLRLFSAAWLELFLTSEVKSDADSM